MSEGLTKATTILIALVAAFALAIVAAPAAMADGPADGHANGADRDMDDGEVTHDDTPAADHDDGAPRDGVAAGFGGAETGGAATYALIGGFMLLTAGGVLALRKGHLS